MKITAVLVKKYSAQSGESIHGIWRSIDTVLKASDNFNGVVANDYIPVRFRGNDVDTVEAIAEGTEVEVRFKIDADERISKNGNTYLAVKDFVMPGYSIVKA